MRKRPGRDKCLRFSPESPASSARFVSPFELNSVCKRILAQILLGYDFAITWTTTPTPAAKRYREGRDRSNSIWVD
jgi:hypothetical protein